MFRLVASGVFALHSALLSIPAHASQGAPSPAAIAQKADEYLQAQAAAGFFSGAVIIAHQGKPLFAKAYGYANAEWQIANTTTTKFRIASITKTFTAALVLKMQEQRKLDVRDGICKYVNPCPEAWKPVTIHHLLTHTAGIPNHTKAPDFMANSRLQRTPAEIVNSFRDKPLDFPPGDRYSYSNSGYMVLAGILEKVGGQSYEHALQEMILDPLGMRDTGYDRHSTVLPKRASGYRPDGAGLANDDYIDTAWVDAAGAMYSTVEDLLKWDRALYSDAVLPQKTRERMWTADKGEYGYGWQVLPPTVKTLNRPLLLHAGGLHGFATDYLRYPNEQVSIIILANLVTSPMMKISRDLSAIAFGEAYALPIVRKPVQVDPKILDSYVGEYQLTPSIALTVTRNGGRLMVQGTGQPQDIIVPESETKFFSRRLDAQATFVKDAAGKVTQLILHQGGRDMTAPKKQI